MSDEKVSVPPSRLKQPMAEATRAAEQSVGCRQLDITEDDTNDVVDEASLELFPASDPPSWTLGEDAPEPGD